MSEIEKMYKNAGVKFIIGVHCRAKTGDGCKSRCPDCDYNTKPKIYPPFTAEKQLSLIKWLFKISDIENINIECEDKFCIHNVLGQSDDCDTLEDALASYINDIWQDLTEQERTEIKEILN